MEESSTKEKVDMAEKKEKGPTPAELAGAFLRGFGTITIDETPFQVLVYWHGEYYRWEAGSYRNIDTDELRVRIVECLKQNGVLASPSMVETVRMYLDNLTFLVKARIPNTLLSDTKNVTQPVRTIVMNNGNVSFATDGSVTFSRHTPDLFALTKLPYDYDASAECPRWITFMEEVTMGDKETQRLLQQWAGYLLTPSQGKQSFLLCLGDAATGKGTYSRAIVRMLGVENCTGVPLRAQGNQFALYQTYGKKLNVAGDAEEELNPRTEGVLKEWTGEDMMSFEKKYGHAFSAYPTARLMISANSFPAFTDKSGGTWRRLLIAKFNRAHPEIKEPGLDATLERELPGIFNWAVRGLLDLQVEGDFTLPAISAALREQYRKDANPAGTFLQEHYRYDPTSQGVLADAIYRRYRMWCSDNGYRPLASCNFGREIFRAYGDVKKVRHRVAGKQPCHYEGLVCID
jgi:putative DNA primase/helicase